MTVHRAQGVVFEQVALWIPLRGCFTQGQEYTAVSRSQRLEGLTLLIVLSDSVVVDMEEAKYFLKNAFQPLMDSIKALHDMRGRAPATVAVDAWHRIVRYGTLLDTRTTYLRPTYWDQV